MFSDSTSNQQSNMDDLSEINEQKHCIVDILTGMSSKNYFNGLQIKTEDQTSVNDPELMNNPNYYRYLNDNNGNYDHPHFYDESNIFNDHITTVNINGWRQKPVEQWLTEDVLYWVYHESGKEGIGILDASLYKLNTLKGKDLLGMTLNNFITEIPNERFAKRLYNSIQSIIGNRPNNIQNITENQQNYDLENDVANILKSCSIEDNKNYIFSYDYVNNLSLANEMNIKEHDSGVDSDSGSEQNMTSDCYDDFNDYLFLHNNNNNKCLTQLNNSNQTNENWQNWEVNNCQGGIIGDSNNQQNVDNDDGLSMMSNDSCKPIVKQEEEDQSPPPIIKKRPGRPRGTRKKKPEKVGRLWEFLRDMLHDPKYNPSIVCWDDYEIGTFRFVQSEQVARLWGSKKENRSMTFEKFSRAMRYYYKAKVFTPVQKRLVYQFGENATGWRRPDPILR